MENQQTIKVLCSHNLIEMYGCDKSILNSKEKMEDIMVESAKLSNATVISSSFNMFEPQGVSGVVVISESHFTVHTWPEFEYAAIDIFTCGTKINIARAIEYLEKELKCKDSFANVGIKRGLIDKDYPKIKSQIINSQIDKVYPREMVEDSIFSLSWQEKYENLEAWGLLSSIDIHDCDPELIRSAEHVKQFAVDLCDFIEMKRFGDTVVVDFGEDEKVAGFSLVQLIETSLISGHFANLTNAAYIDIFSCKFYNPEDAARFASKYFGGKEYKLQVSLRK